jgi:hypothetical protein
MSFAIPIEAHEDTIGADYASALETLEVALRKAHALGMEKPETEDLYRRVRELVQQASTAKGEADRQAYFAQARDLLHEIAPLPRRVTTRH